MYRKGIYFAVTILVATGLLLGAHGEAAPPTQNDAISPMTLKTHYFAAPLFGTKGYEWWAKQVTERTGGAITFQHFYFGALGGASVQLDNIRSGLFDMGLTYPGHYPGKLPAWEVLLVPALTDNATAFNKAMRELSQRPELQAELERWGVKSLFSWTCPSMSYIGIKPLRRTEDFKGLVIRSLGYGAELVKHFGGTPVGIPPEEWYEALQRGTVHGVLGTTNALVGFGLTDPAKHATEKLGFGAVDMPFIVSLKTWNKLDPRVQKIMLEEAARMPSKYDELASIALDEDRAKMRKAGVELYEFPASEATKVREAAKPIWDSWVAAGTSKGVPAKDILDGLLKLIAKYE